MGACEWPIDRACLDESHPLPVLPDTPTDEEQAAFDAALARRNNAEDMAVHVLWALSGRQFGLCPTKVRPCPSTVLRRELYMWSDAAWWPAGCGCVGGCAASGPRAVHLPGPVNTITAVTVNGVALTDADWQLEGDVLYRKGAAWPTQNLDRPAGETGTWSVDYLRGYPTPAGVDILTGLLAVEFINACTDDECRLPSTVVATTRRGVSHEFDPSKILAAGKTGLPEVDMWLAAVNPHRLAAAPEVW